MRNTFISALLLTLSCLGGNLLVNGEFAEGVSQDGVTPSGWRNTGPKSAAAWALADDDGLSGATCAVLRMDGSQAAGTLEQNVTVLQGKTYTLSAALKSDGVSPVLTVLTRGRRRVASLRPDVSSGAVWEMFSVTFTAPEAMLNLRLTGEGRHGMAAVDCIQLTEGNTATAMPETLPVASGHENLALGKTCTWSTAPNFAKCLDGGDKRQLTDGVYTKGFFWAQKSTVGWSSGDAIALNIDLEKDSPITGFAFSTAAGAGGVNWPSFVNVYVSLDQENWYFVDNLMARSRREKGAPPADGYGLYKAESMSMKTHGRYVMFLVQQTPFTFCDELEVYQGGEELLGKAASGVCVKNPRDHVALGMLQARLDGDLGLVLARAAELEEAARHTVSVTAGTLRREVLALPVSAAENLAAILPLNGLHERIYALNSVILRQKGFVAPCIWRNCRWDNLEPTAVPEASADAEAPLEIEMMRGEVRSETFNILNPLDEPLQATVRLRGIPFAAKPDVREVLFTHTKTLETVSCALRRDDGDAVSFRIPAGVSRQVWVSFRRPAMPSGTYDGQVTVVLHGERRGGGAGELKTTLALPVRLVLHDAFFPKAPGLHVGGWTYVSSGGKDDTAAVGPDVLAAAMRDMNVDCPWAPREVCPKGAQFGEDGKLLNVHRLDFSAWDAWVQLWHGASVYCVSLNVRRTFQKEPMGTPRFDRMVSEYVQAWAAHARTQRIKPFQLVFLLSEESGAQGQEGVVTTWGDAICRANAGVRVVSCPLTDDVAAAKPDLFRVSDILWLDVAGMASKGSSWQESALRSGRGRGKELWLFSQGGSPCLLEPVRRLRLSLWCCYEAVVTGMVFRAADNGAAGDSWHAYGQSGTGTLPFFVSSDAVLASKQSEAILEGVEDYEYLRLLSKAIDRLKAENPGHPKLADAECLLSEAPRRVLSSDDGSPTPKDGVGWNAKADRGTCDAVRLEVLRMIDALAGQ